jgi:hypothetical protein
MSIEPFVIFSAGGVLGYLTRLIIEHFLAKDRSKQDRLAVIFNAGANAFKNTFVEEINFLKNNGPSKDMEDTAYHTLFKALPKHTAAYEAFIIHLNEPDRTAIAEAWENYLYPDADRVQEEGNEFILMGYYAEVEEHESAQRKRALENINKLLEHAKPK